MKLKIQKSNTEQVLIERCKRRESKAQKELYDRFAPRMLGLCIRYVKEKAEAEDVMIRGFTKMFERIDQYEGIGSFEGWVKRIMINESLTYIRRNKAMYVEVEIEKADLQPDYSSVGGMLETNDLLHLIESLPTGYRTIFNLYAIEGYSHKEIGDMLGINENTSKSQLSRARMVLKKKILDIEADLNKKKGSDGRKFG